MPPLKAEQPDFYFSTIYATGLNKIEYKREIRIKNAVFNTSQMKNWNEQLDLLNNSYNNQLSLTKQ